MLFKLLINQYNNGNIKPVIAIDNKIFTKLISTILNTNLCISIKKIKYDAKKNINLIHILLMDSENKNSEFFLCIKKTMNIKIEVNPKIRFDIMSINTERSKIKKGRIFS
tara:strand:+ start:1101 stop:1430 length:330 start_codon:yes stop_codon:yes gene_type:complete